jgi:uncharacterized protein YkwD
MLNCAIQLIRIPWQRSMSVVLVLCFIMHVQAQNSSGKKESTVKKTPAKSSKPAAKPAVKPDGAENAVISGQSLNTALVTRLVFQKTNQERVKAGLPTFQHLGTLEAAATDHSADMARRNYFSHKSKGLLFRKSVAERTDAAGVGTRRVAENIAMLPTFRQMQVFRRTDTGASRVTMDTNTYDQLATWALEQWMESPGHRQNILNPELRYLGVGTALGDRNGVPYVYLTQNFAG